MEKNVVYPAASYSAPEMSIELIVAERGFAASPAGYGLDGVVIPDYADDGVTLE